MIKKCENCGKEFETSKNVRFCSSFCTHSYSSKHLKHNEWECVCGEKFNSKRELNKHRKICLLYIETAKANRAWAKGLTKETNSGIYKQSNTRKLKYKEKKLIPSGGRAKTKENELERRKKISNSMKGDKNWKFNKHRGTCKHGWYKGIYCDSSWELAFLVYHLEHNLNIKRCTERRKYIFNNEIHIYIPDFITDEGIIEIKGRVDKKAIEKHKLHPDIIIYDKSKIQPYLDYVIIKYGPDFWIKLYLKSLYYV